MSNITKDQVIEWLSAQPILDLAALVKELETKWGVSAAAAAGPRRKVVAQQQDRLRVGHGAILPRAARRPATPCR